MDRIKNFQDTVEHRQPEDIVMDLGGCPLSSVEGQTQARLLRYLVYDAPDDAPLLFGKVRRLDERLLRALDIDTRSVGEIFRPRESQFRFLADDLYIDEWGIKRKFTGMYWDIVENPLKNATCADLDRYQWPDADSIDPAEIAAHVRCARELKQAGEYVICAEHPVYGVFELGCWLCGFDDFLTRLFIDEPFVRRLFDIILDYQKKVIAQYYGALGDLIHYTSSGDDFAMQTNLFMPPETFRALIAPYYKERIAHTKKYTGAKYLHHSCGDVFKIVDDLLDAGVEILNPIQPCCAEMAPENLKAAYGDRVVFHGGVDTQKLLNFGSREEIAEGVHAVLEALGRGGGYIFAAAHNLQDDVPPENIVAMFEAARKYGKR